MTESRNEKPRSVGETSPDDNVRDTSSQLLGPGLLWGAIREQMAIFTATWSTTRLIRRGIGLSGVRSLKDLVDIVAAKRGKPIILTEVLPPEVSGFCARGRDRDYIVVDANASELARLHVSLHELFHLWDEHPADHSPHEPIPPDVVRQMLPGLKPEPVLKVLARVELPEGLRAACGDFCHCDGGEAS